MSWKDYIPGYQIYKYFRDARQGMKIKAVGLMTLYVVWKNQ